MASQPPALLVDANGNPIRSGGWDATNHQFAFPSILNVSNDSVNGIPNGSMSATLQAGTALVGAHALSDGLRASYSASINGLVSAASATDIFTLTGSASKTVRITRVEVNGQQTTAASALIVLLMRSTANTAGTSTNPTRVPLDSGNAAVTATVNAYTANPTVGTLIGNIRSEWLFLSAPATTAAAEKLNLEFGNRPAQAIVLRGITQVFAINLNGVTVTGGTFNINIEWTEDNS